MDQEKRSGPAPELGLYACDQELFDRVWKRVMPEEKADCPIVTAEARPAAPIQTGGAAPVQAQPALPQDTPPQAAEPVPETIPPAVGFEPQPAAEEPDGSSPPESEAPPENGAPTGDDFPAEDAVPCLGSGSAPHGSQLQTYILAELEGWQLYRHLARRVTGSQSRVLSALASEKHLHARRLATAYFLISGVRYWPTDRLAVPRPSAWLGTLRARFSQEQRQESRYRAAACDTNDPCLADLYTELAQGCAGQAAALRGLLESAL